jgi:hypothetical protein
MLVYNATEQPWTIGYGGQPEDDFGVITSPHRDRAICNMEPRDYKIENAMLICAAPPLLKVAQKLLLWLEECDLAIEFNHDDLALYDELRQVIRTAGGFSSETHWWQGPCICSACGHAWQGVVEIPIEFTYPQVPLECSECHQMTGGPAPGLCLPESRQTQKGG